MPRSLDTTDLVITQMMLADCRRPDVEVAKFLELGEDEVNRRIASLREDGIVRDFVARIPPSHLRAVNVFIFGTSEISSLKEAREKLGKNDSSSWIGLAAGSRIYVGATLRRLIHLDSYVVFLREELGMTDLTFGIRSGLPRVHEERPSLDSLDYRILASLRRDARKSLFEVGREIGEDRTVVEARVHRMREEGAVEFSIELDPEATSDIICMIHLWRRGRGELKPFMRDKLNEHSPHILFFNQYRNLTDLTMAMCWVPDMSQLRAILRSFQSRDDFYHVEANPLLTSCNLEDWADRLILERSKGADGSTTERPQEVA
ncbi:MAG: AsnC family transcriptional regulator [Methanomassiliicoccales archaeon]|nr:AsnC family transcriptional regulator [Methanomassiliicoccales archaeon]